MLDKELDIDIELETLALEDVMDESDTLTTTQQPQQRRFHPPCQLQRRYHHLSIP